MPSSVVECRAATTTPIAISSVTFFVAQELKQVTLTEFPTKRLLLSGIRNQNPCLDTICSAISFVGVILVVVGYEFSGVLEVGFTFLVKEISIFWDLRPSQIYQISRFLWHLHRCLPKE
jgi:hypothetical protein